MLIELLIVLLIIIIVLLFLLFIKSWHIHIIFKNDNLDYDLYVVVSFLILGITIKIIDKPINILFQLNINSKTYDIKNIEINSNQSDDGEETDKTPNDESEEKKLFQKLSGSYELLYDARKDLAHIVKLLVQMITFKYSFARINIGLMDNNLTIKFCNLLWALTAPLYPLNFRVILTPEINRLLVKSDVDIKMDLRLLNLLKILFNIVKRRKLRNLINYFIN